jgi:hypothetical protein
MKREEKVNNKNFTIIDEIPPVRKSNEENIKVENFSP